MLQYGINPELVPKNLLRGTTLVLGRYRSCQVLRKVVQHGCRGLQNSILIWKLMAAIVLLLLCLHDYRKGAVFNSLFWVGGGGGTKHATMFNYV